MLKTLTPLRKSLEKNNKHSQSLNNFVLLNQNRQIQSNYQWKPFKMRQKILERTSSLNRQISFGGSYQTKKSVLKALSSYQKKSQINNISPDKQIGMDIFLKSKLNLNLKLREVNYMDSNKSNVERKRNSTNRQKMETKLSKFTNTTNNFNEKVQKNIQLIKQRNILQNQMSTAAKTERRFEDTTLVQTIRKASLNCRRVIVLFSMKRYGLRMRLNHCFTSVCVCKVKSHQSCHNFSSDQKIVGLCQQLLSTNQQKQKELYFFHINKQLINSSNQLPLSEYTLLVSSNPILNIDNQFHFKLYEESQKLQRQIKSIENQLQINIYSMSKKSSNHKLSQKKRLQRNNSSNNQFLSSDQQEYPSNQNNPITKYDWQRINSVKQYVQNVVQNPQIFHKPNIVNQPSSGNKLVKQEMKSWYDQKFTSQNSNIKEKQSNLPSRNPLLQDHNHYPQELKNKRILNLISRQLENQEFIKCTHNFKKQPIQVLMQKVKRQKERELEEIRKPNIINRNIQNIHKTKKAVLLKLDNKNSLLFQQNIPYMMDKYGINRYEIHNLYNLYKTLQKISAIKLRPQNKTKQVYQKGIDRQTFDEGMKKLDINPGEQVIKNICYFDDFVSWQQFIKIVSIGLRKTPQQKLDAILSGIGGANNGLLSRNQISIMIGSSLTKIFDCQQLELREYFTKVAMSQLDTDGSGDISVQEIKEKVLQVSNMTSAEVNQDLVTFLLLNS